LRNLGGAPQEFHFYWGSRIEGEVVGTTSWMAWRYKDNCVIPADGEWHEISFENKSGGYVYEGYEKGAELYPMPLFKPFGYFQLYPTPMPTGVEMHFQVAEIRGEDDVVPEGEVAWTAPFPTRMAAGGKIALPGFTVNFRGRAPLDKQARLVFRKVVPLSPNVDEPEVPFVLENVAMNGDSWSMEPTEWKLTEFLNSGEYDVTLECGEAVLDGMTTRVAVDGRENVGFSSMSVRMKDGRPTMHKNGEPIAGVMRATYTTEGPLGITKFSEAGVKIFGFCSTPTAGCYDLEMNSEYVDGRYDFQQFDRRMRNTLAVNPDAMLIVRLFLHAPVWWTQKHPDDVDRVGLPDDPSGKTWPLTWHQGQQVPSWASRPWRDYTNKGLRELIAFLEKTPYADHIAGFVLASGCTEEWMEWASDDGVVGDYSPASEKAFREWLTRKYSTDEALQKAWNDGAVTLSTATQPKPYERAVNDFAGFLPPEAPGARRIADYNHYHADNVSGCIGEFCETIKSASHGSLLAGAFYGYFLELSGSRRLVYSGHLGVGNILKNKNVDYLCSPTGYAFRQVGGDGCTYAMGAADSLQLHNKFWFIENDIRTSATPNALYGRPDDTWGDVLQQTKESIHNVLTGMAQWWFDVGYIRFKDPEVFDIIGKCVEVMEAATLEYSREPVAQVALVIDEESVYWTTISNAQIMQGSRNMQRRLGELGAPFETYLSDDLENLPERIRVVVLPISLTWKEEHRLALRKLERDGRVIVYMGTPGVIPPKSGMSREESAFALTNLPLRYGNATLAPKLLIDSVDDDWLPQESIAREIVCSFPKQNDSEFVIASLDETAPGVRIFGHYVDRATGQKLKGGAIGVRESPNATIVYCGTIDAPNELMVSVLRKAGVHVYVDTPDAVWATKDIFAVCVKEGGIRSLKVPKACAELVDMISGECYKVDAEGIACVDFLPRQTKVFLMR
ncbi:MAG: beta-galactosidase, partial [Lentisphaeria bacterium]|nr:beta-galactosidase [Lentisphaeria bacterium]